MSIFRPAGINPRLSLPGQGHGMALALGIMSISLSRRAVLRSIAVVAGLGSRCDMARADGLAPVKKPGFHPAKDETCPEREHERVKALLAGRDWARFGGHATDQNRSCK
jgi:hypothetical protein